MLYRYISYSNEKRLDTPFQRLAPKPSIQSNSINNQTYKRENARLGYCAPDILMEEQSERRKEKKTD